MLIFSSTPLLRCFLTTQPSISLSLAAVLCLHHLLLLLYLIHNRSLLSLALCDLSKLLTPVPNGKAALSNPIYPSSD